MRGCSTGRASEEVIVTLVLRAAASSVYSAAQARVCPWENARPCRAPDQGLHRPTPTYLPCPMSRVRNTSLVRKDFHTALFSLLFSLKKALALH